MFAAGFLFTRTLFVFFLFVSFWPWESDSDETKKTSLEIPANLSQVDILRVALFYERPEVLVGVNGPYEVHGFPTNQALTQGTFLPATPVRPEPSGIRFGPTLFRVSGLRIQSETKEVRVGNRAYHDTIQVLKNPKGSLTLVNEIDVEEYLKGVLPWESNPEWPKEALKAQAVASRTYAIFKNIENRDFPFVLSSDEGSQVYRGKTIEKSATNRAVEKTRGQILTYRGKIFPAFFHSTCGGRTTRAEYQWRVEPHPSLQGVECSFCRGSKYFSWKAELSVSEIESLLAKKGYAAPGLKEIRPEKLDPSERPRFFVLQYREGSLTLPANEFRLGVGSDRMRSTKVKIERAGERFIFRGRGWGHGVGMCQFGSKQLAELGYDYREILRYYYPGAEIRNLEDLTPGGISEPRASQDENIFRSWYDQLKSYVEDL